MSANTDDRFPEELIDDTLCLARDVGDDACPWPFGRQCGLPQIEGSNLCVRCEERYTKFHAGPGSGIWCGFIREQLPYWRIAATKEFLARQKDTEKQEKEAKMKTELERLIVIANEILAVLARLRARQVAPIANK